MGAGAAQPRDTQPTPRESLWLFWGGVAVGGDLGVQLGFGMGWKSLQHYEICRGAAGGRTDGWTDGWIPTTPGAGRAQSSPPLPFMEQFGMGKPPPSPQSRGKAVSPSSAQGHALVLRLPKKKKFSDRFSIPGPVRGLGPAKSQVSGALGDRAKPITGHWCHPGADGFVGMCVSVSNETSLETMWSSAGVMNHGAGDPR